MRLPNYHMHTTFCDGANTPAEMAAAAAAMGCPEIGFSGHSFLDFDAEWTMAPEAAARYREIVLGLRDDYAGQMDIFLGIEQDACSEPDELSLYDYVIGGVHCVFRNGHYVSVDASAKSQREGVEEWYDGDAAAFAEDYFRMVGNLYESTRCDIVAHFDLLTKFLEQDDLIDPKDPKYQKAQNDALEQLFETPVVFEINTGAISRGYRTSPYPSDDVLEALRKAGKPVVLSSDSHAAGTILSGFDEAMHLVKKHDLRLLTSMEEILAYTRG